MVHGTSSCPALAVACAAAIALALLCGVPVGQRYQHMLHRRAGGNESGSVTRAVHSRGCGLCCGCLRRKDLCWLRGHGDCGSVCAVLCCAHAKASVASVLRSVACRVGAVVCTNIPQRQPWIARPCSGSARHAGRAGLVQRRIATLACAPSWLIACLCRVRVPCWSAPMPAYVHYVLHCHRLSRVELTRSLDVVCCVSPMPWNCGFQPGRRTPLGTAPVWPCMLVDSARYTWCRLSGCTSLCSCCCLPGNSRCPCTAAGMLHTHDK